MVALSTPGAGSARYLVQQLHLSEAPLQMQPWAHLAQPMGQQEQQPFLQEGHLQTLQVQEPAQLQEPPARKAKASCEQGEEGSISRSPSHPHASGPALELPVHSGRQRSPSFSLPVPGK